MQDKQNFVILEVKRWSELYPILALVNGILLAIMVSINGELSKQYGVFSASVLIHIAGTASASLCLLKKGKKPLWTHHPKWIYLGGAIGVCTTVFQCIAAESMSITSVVALGLLGQTAATLFNDKLGLLGMKKRPFPQSALISLCLSVLGIFMMLDDENAVVAIGIACAAGISVVLSRTINAYLAEKTGALQGALINHLIGLPITILLAAATVKWSDLVQRAPLSGTSQPWIYFGGVLGVGVVMLFNIIVPKLSSFLLTSLVFIAQIFTGIILDSMQGLSCSDASLYGGLVIAFGVVVYMAADRINPCKRTKASGKCGRNKTD